MCVRSANRTASASTCATPTEIAALDYLVAEWNASRSQIIRSMIVGAAMTQLDDPDALESGDQIRSPLPSLDDVLLDLPLPELPSIDDVLAAP